MAGNATERARIGWVGIARLGLVQAAIGAVVLLTTSTLNRVMVVELALAAVLPGALVGWHYAIQMLRPRWGHGGDGGRRTPWISGGVAVLAIGGVCAAAATALMERTLVGGIAAAAFAFFLIGVGVGAGGTNLLALLAISVAPARKAAAAAIVWIMMIVGFVLTAGIAGAALEPFSMSRLIEVAAGVGAVAVALTVLATLGLEPSGACAPARVSDKPSFRDALKDVLSDQPARRFTLFVFVSMLAYSAQDLILEPFAGLVYDMTPGESTKLSGVQNGGVLLGMILTAVVGTLVGKSRVQFMRSWSAAGCIASAAALFALSGAAVAGPEVPLAPLVFSLGLANGAFAVAAIGSMMALASAGAPQREGVRMGVWGAAQALGFGLGGFLGAAALDGARAALGATSPAFAAVFAVEALLFVAAAILSFRVGSVAALSADLPAMARHDALPAE